MKQLITLTVVSVLSALNFGLQAQDASQALWPEDKTPFALPVDQESGKPQLHLYLTKGAENHTGAAVVVCPGGGYGSLAKDHEGHQIAEWYAKQGVSAFVLHYRLGTEGHHYPTQLADVQRAIRWVRSHADEHLVDPSRIAVMGFSAGGHLASMAATLFDREVYPATDDVDKASARPDLAILCYPVISLDRAISHGGSRKNLLGADRDTDDALAADLSSENNVTENTPPTFLFQTDADKVVPAENATRFFLALRQHGVPCEYHVYQNGPHGVGLNLGDPVLGGWSELLKNWLKVNHFFAPPQARTALRGEVSLDGELVSWGVLTFYPEDENLPATSIRVRRGKFSVKENDGPILGQSSLMFEGSIWESTQNPEDKAVNLAKLSPGDPEGVHLEIAANAPALNLAYRSR